MFYIKRILVVCLFIQSLSACKEEFPAPLFEGGPPPAPVTNVSVSPLPGGAKITYTLPDSKNLLYVKAVYEPTPGKIRESKASLYGDSLFIDGLPSTDELDVKLYSVNKGEIPSEPVQVKVKPLTPPVFVTFASLTIKEDFGGVYVTYQNPSKSKIVITVLVKDSVGDWQQLDAYYTSNEGGYFTSRGLDSKPMEFGVYVRDRWDNKSDTLFTTLTPIYEKELTGLKVVPYPGEPTTFYSNNNYTRLFDKNFADAAGLTHTAVGSGVPQSFTIDLGTVSKLSRLKYWMRGIVANPTYLFGFGNPEIWELWGSNNPDPDGGYMQWVKMMDCVAVKPSGLPIGQYSTEDREVGAAGLDFSFPSDVPPVRYLRWKTNKVFGDVSYVHIMELAFWGQ